MSDAATSSTSDRVLHGELPFEGALKEVTGTELVTHRCHDRVTSRQHLIGHVLSWSVRRWDADQVGMATFHPVGRGGTGIESATSASTESSTVAEMNTGVEEFCFVERCVLFEGWKAGLKHLEQRSTLAIYIRYEYATVCAHTP
ncbi:hypothetical protein R4P64_31910 [Rhodococcus sp. IEGM 1366]|uniref:hypothetical protein n=1 Tax=Rhodococcus sp. IEGM 1366 TaxID=3082223 RepID=UPI0029555EBF|nr:hypothetical protein [Rhodococcus sp. IEGM 1366]MDV8071127.1 hypothetical protein [Rhodococcus sp. IEGM 1366]